MRLAEAQKRESLELPAFNIPYCAGVRFILYIIQIGFVAADTAVSPVFGDVAARDLGMAFPAVFLILLHSVWESPTAAHPWFVGLIVAVVTYLPTRGAWYVPADALVGPMTIYFQRRQK